MFRDGLRRLIDLEPDLSVCGDAPDATLLQQAYDQMKRQNFEHATRTIYESLRVDGESADARRYLAYTLLQRGLAKEALDQIQLMKAPSGFDMFMKGTAYEALGDPKRAAESFQTAVDKEPGSDFFRTKAIKALITVSKYRSAATLCIGGQSAKDAKAKKYYDDELIHTEYLETATAKDRPCIQPKH